MMNDITMEELFIFFGVLIGLMIIAVVFAVVAIGRREKANAACPVRRGHARLIDKPQPSSANGIVIYSRVWIMFELDGGERVRLVVPGNNSMVVGESGELTWQGDKLISFTRDGERRTGGMVTARGTAVEPHAERGTSFDQSRIPAWKKVEMQSEGYKVPTANVTPNVGVNRADSIRCKYCSHFEPGVNRCHLYHDFDQSLDKRGGAYFKETSPSARCSHFSLTAMDAIAKDLNGKRPDGSLILELSDVPGLKL